MGAETTPKLAGWYKRLFAYMMSRSDGYEELVGNRKRSLFSKLDGNILEIGAGTAPNLTYFPGTSHWMGVDPNPAMFKYAQETADRLGRTVELREGHSEALPVPDESMDAVVSTLVLCSVSDLQKTLQEIRRVLKPGGQFVFIEHVAAPEGSSLRRWQTFIRPAWQAWADGCQLNRETWTFIENAGFSHVQIDHFHVDAPLISPHIAGVAVK